MPCLVQNLEPWHSSCFGPNLLTAAPREPVVTGRKYAQMWVPSGFLGCISSNMQLMENISARQGAENAGTPKAREAGLEPLEPKHPKSNLKSKIMTC